MPSLSRTTALRSRYSFDGELIEQGALPALAVSAIFAAIVLAGVVSGVIGYSSAELDPLLGSVFLLWLCGLGIQLLGACRFGQAIKALAVYLLIFISSIIASTVLAVVSLDYSDRVLVAADKAFFGFDWKTAVPAMTSNRQVGIILSYAYASLNWQPFLMLAYLFAVGKEARFWQALTATAIALGLCIGIFPFCPAVGGYIHFGIAQETVPHVIVPSAWEASLILHGLKSGAIHVLSLNTLEGVVTMPSFHAASGVILAWSLWTTRLRLPFLAINGIMLISTVPIGGHYLVDVIAGLAVAWLGLWMAKSSSDVQQLSSQTKKTVNLEPRSPDSGADGGSPATILTRHRVQRREPKCSR